MRKLSLHSMPALGVATLFACGILLSKQIAWSVSTWFLFACTSLISIILWPLLRSHLTRFALVHTVLLSLLAIALGATRLAIDSASVFVLPPDLINKPVTLTGIVLDPYPSQENRSQFLLAVDSIRGLDGTMVQMNTKTFVTVTRQRKDSVAGEFRYGERVRLTGKVYRPPAERNPGEFNSRAYYEAQGINYLMRVRGHAHAAVLDSIVRGGPYGWLMRSIVVPLRSYMLLLIDQTVGGSEGELLKGIAIGERSGIPVATRVAFVNSGIAHILAVSGSNVVVVYAFFVMLFGILRVPRRTAIVLNAFMLILYMLLTGSQPPIVRATVMALVILLGKLSGGRTNSLNTLGLAALIILAYDPRQLFDVGFQLSFTAVASIVYFYPPINALILRVAGKTFWRRGLVGALQVSAITLVATLGTLPLTAIYFGKFSVVGLLTNIIILPLVGVSVTLGFVASLLGWWALPVAEAFATANKLVLWLILQTAQFSGNLSWAFVETLSFKPIHAVPFYLALLWLFHLPIKNVSRVLLVLFLGSLNLFLFVPEHRLDRRLPDRLRVSFMDVGQGDAALIEFPDGRTMLIDAGMWSEAYDAGEQIVTPFLKRRGITTLDWFVASHPHADHIGGVPHVFQSFDVKEVLESGQPTSDPVYARYIKALEEERAVVRRARVYDSAFAFGGARVYILYPTPEVVLAGTSDAYKNLNNISLVLKLHYGESSFLFMGDLEREGEAHLCRMFGDFLRADVLKAGHHGSSTSSTLELLTVVRPRYAVISVGRHNTFNHPSAEVLDRLNQLGVEILRTDEEGAIVFETDGTTLQPVDWR